MSELRDKTKTIEENSQKEAQRNKVRETDLTLKLEAAQDKLTQCERRLELIYKQRQAKKSQ